MSQEPNTGQEHNEVTELGTKSGEPFKTVAAAKSVMATQTLDPKVWGIEPREGGFVIAKRTPASKQAPTAATRLETPAEKVAIRMGEKYHKVRFHERHDANQDPSVILSVQGEVLTCMRGVETIIPQRFREVADHATQPHYVQLPGVDRKVDGHIRTWPYDYLGEATEEEFNALRKEGTEKTRAEANKDS